MSKQILMKHDDLQNSLAAHLRGSTDRMVWTNTQLGPSGSPRPDVFTVDKSFARFACDAYEIKVSVADLRRDVTSGKWQSYLQFAHRVWFAFPRGMVPLDEIPRECGVILMGDVGQWRAARKPIAKSLDSLPRNAWLKLLIDVYPEHPGLGVRQSPRISNAWHMEAAIRKKAGDQAAQIFSRRQRALWSFEETTRELEQSAEKIKEEIAARRKSASADLERQQVSLTSAMQALGESLGIPKGEATAEILLERIHGFRRSIGVRNIERVLAQLEQLRDCIEPKTEDADA